MAARMTRKQLLALCERRPGAVAEYPFGPTARVYKVGGKMFALVAEDALKITLKCDPALADMLRRKYPAVTPGYYMNKRHWNTVAVDGSIPSAEVAEMVQASYDLVVRSLPKADREALST